MIIKIQLAVITGQIANRKAPENDWHGLCRDDPVPKGGLIYGCQQVQGWDVKPFFVSDGDLLHSSEISRIIPSPR